MRTTVDSYILTYIDDYLPFISCFSFLFFFLFHCFIVERGLYYIFSYINVFPFSSHSTVAIDQSNL